MRLPGSGADGDGGAGGSLDVQIPASLPQKIPTVLIAPRTKMSVIPKHRHLPPGVPALGKHCCSMLFGGAILPLVACSPSTR